MFTDNAVSRLTDINPAVKCVDVEGHYHPGNVDISFTCCFAY